MKPISLKFLALLLVIGVAFNGCSDDDDDFVNPNALENVDIFIDQDQTFNMSKFVMSFEQMFGGDARWTWDYSHDVQSGKALVSYQNFKVLGEFGDKVFTINHDFNSNGAITSSTRMANMYYHGDDIIFTYRYDTEGKIVQLTKRINGNIRDVVELEYNSNNQLVKKTHIGDYHFNDGDEEEFTYNSDGTVKSYYNSHWQNTYNYTYDNGNMTRQERNYGSGTEVEILGYDSQGRVITFYNESYINNRTYFEYYDSYFKQKIYYDYNGTSRLEYITDYSAYQLGIKSWDFRYNGPTFDYCRTREFSYVENGYRRLVDKKEYLTGTPENLVLVGYVTVDTRDPANNYKKTRESIYEANGTLLYYITYDVSNGSIQSHQVYEPDGTPIDDSEMNNQLDWVDVLISDIDMTKLIWKI